jgi:transcriptional regulator with XRE-family HTH domain
MLWAMANDTANPRSRVRRRRASSELIGAREAQVLCATIGASIRAGRKIKGLTQARLGDLIGISQPRVSEMERGLGAGAPLGTWISAGIAVGRPLAISMSRSIDGEPADSGHLAAQETVLRNARTHGRFGTFELRTRSSSNSLYIDVGLRDVPRRTMGVIEIWNRFDDLGAGERNFKRKLAETAEMAVVAGGDGEAFHVTGCWVLRATAANRTLVARYPTIFGGAFRGSSRAWVKALTEGAPMPLEPGLVWIDLAGKTFSEVRLRTGDAL